MNKQSKHVRQHCESIQQDPKWIHVDFLWPLIFMYQAGIMGTFVDVSIASWSDAAA